MALSHPVECILLKKTNNLDFIAEDKHSAASPDSPEVPTWKQTLPAGERLSVCGAGKQRTLRKENLMLPAFPTGF